MNNWKSGKWFGLSLLHIHYNMKIDLDENQLICKASSEENRTGQYPV